MPFLLVREDINKMKVDAIINLIDIECKQIREISQRLSQDKGLYKLFSNCKDQECKIGDITYDKVINLPSKYVIHTVVDFNLQNPITTDSIRSVFSNPLLLAKKLNLESVAFCMLYDSFSYEGRLVLNFAFKSIKEFLDQNDMMIYFVLNYREELPISKSVISGIDSFLEQGDRSSSKNAYYSTSDYDEHAEYASKPFDDKNDILMLESPSARFGDEDSFIKKNTVESSNNSSEIVLEANIKLSNSASPGKGTLDDIVNHMGESFSEMLMRLIDDRNLKDSVVYKRANIDRRLFSKMRSNKKYTPNKKTIISFAIALELSLDETKDLLMRAGYSLSVSSKFDLIISYFIEEKHYDIFEINEALFYYGEPILGGC